MTSKYISAKFWIDTLDRVVATTAQAAVAAITANATGILEVDPVQVASVAGLAGAVALLTSIAFRGRGETPPEVTKTTVLAAHAQLDPDEQNADVQAAVARHNLLRKDLQD